MIYHLIMSKGENIRIDSEDLQKLQDNNSSFMVILKQAIVRPPFVVAIVPTDEKETISRIEIREGVPHKVGELKKLQDLMSVEKFKKLI